jgi:dipeptidyl aminopeptidase/acylaminoacyl peptidase
MMAPGQGPTMFTRRSILAAGALLPALRASGAAAQVRPHALDDFFTPQVTRDAALSPDGKRVAVLIDRGAGDRRRAVLQLFAADDPAKVVGEVAIGDDGYDVESVEWAGDKRLLVGFTTTTTRLGRKVTGSNLGANGDRAVYTFRRILAVGPDGSKPVIMFGDQNDLLQTNLDLSGVVDLLPDDPDHVVMEGVEPGPGILALYKVNVNTGQARWFERGTASTVGYFVHRGVAVARFEAERGGSVLVIRVRAPGERQWKLAHRMRRDQDPDFFIVGGTKDANVVVVGARLESEDEVSVRELDLRTLAFGAPISRRAGHDAIGGVTDEAGRLIAAAYYESRLVYDFSDKAMAPHHRAMDRFFDNEANTAIRDVDARGERLLTHVSGPREPGTFYLYDKAAKRYGTLGSTRPNLDPERLGKMEALKVKTRDGAQIDAFLTAPPGGRPGPLVALIHGGPEQRDVYGWDRQAQVLAAQGWWVIQPNFRGSGGYGRAFAEAGWRRWNGRMQEDVEDAVAQAIASHKLDGARVGIMGTSYGGYAALMGAARRPDLYRAAVSICGVADLTAMLQDAKRWDDGPDQYGYRFWVKRLGDLRDDAGLLTTASPSRYAARISAPVMLVHGVDDRIVSVEQSRTMHRALRSAGKPVEMYEIKGWGHADWPDSVERDLMARYVGLFQKAFRA